MKNNIVIVLVIFENLIFYLLQDDYNVVVNMDHVFLLRYLENLRD